MDYYDEDYIPYYETPIEKMRRINRINLIRKIIREEIRKSKLNDQFNEIQPPDRSILFPKMPLEQDTTFWMPPVSPEDLEKIKRKSKNYRKKKSIKPKSKRKTCSCRKK